MVLNHLYFLITIPVNLLILVFIIYGAIFNNSTLDLITYFLPFVLFLIFYMCYLIFTFKFEILNLQNHFFFKKINKFLLAYYIYISNKFVYWKFYKNLFLL